MYLYRGHSANTSYGNGDGVDKETSKNDIETGHIVKKGCAWHEFFYVHFSGTQSFLSGFSRISDNITASNKKNMHVSVFEIAT